MHYLFPIIIARTPEMTDRIKLKRENRITVFLRTNSYSPSPFSNYTAYDSCTSVHSQFNNKPYDSVAEISTYN